MTSVIEHSHLHFHRSQPLLHWGLPYSSTAWCLSDTESWTPIYRLKPKQMATCIHHAEPNQIATLFPETGRSHKHICLSVHFQNRHASWNLTRKQPGALFSAISMLVGDWCLNVASKTNGSHSLCLTGVRSTWAHNKCHNSSPNKRHLHVLAITSLLFPVGL